MQKIVPHLWYDKEAKEAALLYTGLFDHSRLDNVTVIEDTPSGDAESVSFVLAGQDFMAISGGPFFKFNPSISFMVNCRLVNEVDQLWEKLIGGGEALMPLGEYPFSKRYGWLQDRYGLSWQLNFSEVDPAGTKIVPNLLFSNETCGRAEAAVHFYTGVFPDSEIGLISKYAEGEASSPRARVNYAAFNLSGVAFSAMDNGFDVDYGFNEAISFVVHCQDQAEIDYYWDKLSAVPEAEQCGWLKDQFGVSWQIVPKMLDEIMTTASPEVVRRVTAEFLQMKKLDIATLEQARDQT